jgi:hypothetical protein
LADISPVFTIIFAISLLILLFFDIAAAILLFATLRHYLPCRHFVLPERQRLPARRRQRQQPLPLLAATMRCRCRCSAMPAADYFFASLIIFIIFTLSAAAAPADRLACFGFR